MTPQDTAATLEAFGVLAAMSSSPRWETGDERTGTAKSIGQEQWKRALVIALILDKEVPTIPAPIPGADPAGFIWITWKDDRGEVAFEFHDALVAQVYDWTVTRDGMKKKHSATSLRDLCESLRATFKPKAEHASV